MEELIKGFIDKVFIEFCYIFLKLFFYILVYFIRLKFFKDGNFLFFCVFNVWSSKCLNDMYVFIDFLLRFNEDAWGSWSSSLLIS